MDLILTGTKTEEFANKWAKRLKYQIQIPDPENPGEMIDNPEERDTFLSRKMYEQACLDVENQIKEDMQAMVDTAVHDILDNVSLSS